MNKLLESFDDLPRYLLIDTGEDVWYFHPTIIKWETLHSSNAYYAMYARYYPNSGTTNAAQVLFYVSASSFDEVISKFIEEYGKMSSFVKNRSWTGEKPAKIDLFNNKIDHYVYVRNVNKSNNG